MRFTSSIVRLINQMVAFGRNRSEATKVALFAFKNFATLAATDVERAVEKADKWLQVKEFEAALATGKVVTVFFGKKESVATGSGAVEQRDCISLTAAVEKRMFKIEGTGRNIPAHCCGFFDLTVESDKNSPNYGKVKGPRMFLRDNYIGFKM